MTSLSRAAGPLMRSSGPRLLCRSTAIPYRPYTAPTSSPSPKKPAPPPPQPYKAPAPPGTSPGTTKPEPGSFNSIFRDRATKEERNAPPPQLTRPLGMPYPPEPEQNSGVDRRSWKERWADFISQEKNRERRNELTRKMFTPYLRDYSRMSKDFRGKSFFSPTRLFRSDRALYFPNFVGKTLYDSHPQDTTTILRDRISVVVVHNTQWALEQVRTFVYGLDAMDEFVRGEAQRVDVSIEENYLKQLAINMSVPSLRKMYPEERWEKYFMIYKGVTDDIREASGLWNSKVGYVFLVDEECKIRWAGSGDAHGKEREVLVWGVKKLVEEARERRKRGGSPKGENSAEAAVEGTAGQS